MPSVAANSVGIASRDPLGIQISIAKKGEQAVSNLWPTKPVVLNGRDTIAAISKVLGTKRARAGVVMGGGGTTGVAGIITDKDICRRVVAKGKDVTTTSLAEIMTRNPLCVSMSDSAVDALTIMVENRYRHLPVLDDSGQLCGLLDIGRCLDDAIGKLESAKIRSEKSTANVLQQVGQMQGADTAAIQAMLSSVMSQAFGANKTVPTMRTVCANTLQALVKPNTSVLDAAKKMAEAQRAAMVIE